VYALLVMDKKLGATARQRRLARQRYGLADVPDLNRLLLYADARGRMRDTLQRVELTIMDALVAGEGKGRYALTRGPCTCCWLR
jgi:hypothetical protein